MSEVMSDDEYQKEYTKAMAELDAAAQGKPAATTVPEAKEVPPAKVEESKPEEPEKQPDAAPEPKPLDPVEELRLRLEKTEKALKDTQAWGTKNAQRLKEIEQERERIVREANKPQILQQAPELEQAIRYVTSDPQPQQQAVNPQQQWQAIVDAAHPGIFAMPDDDELVRALVAKRDAAAGAWDDPLVAIREITAEKLAHTERQLGKRFAAESAKLAQKSAMSVPGAGSSAVSTQSVDKALEEAKRIQSMSDADFAKEVRRVKGY